MMDVRELENRYIFLTAMQNLENFFFKTLIDKQAYSLGDITNITPIGIAFYITPLINALIRVGTKEEKEKLFLAFIDGSSKVPSNKRGHKPGEMESIAVQVGRACTNARTRQNKIKETAMEQLDIKVMNNCLDENKVILVEVEEEEEFDKTLTGLVAMQLNSKYRKPTLVLRKSDDGYLRGSARGNQQSELKDAKQFFEESGFFEYTIGHSNAHGASIHSTKVNDFIAYANEKLANVNFNEGIYEVDFIRYGNSMDLGKIIQELGKESNIFGQENPEPLIAVLNINLMANEIQVIGSNKDTFKFEKNGVTYIKFKAKGLIEELSQFDSITLNVIGRPNINYFRGQESMQLMLLDYEVKDNLMEF